MFLTNAEIMSLSETNQRVKLARISTMENGLCNSDSSSKY